MKRSIQLAVMLAVAFAIPASPIVLARVRGAAAPAQKDGFAIKGTVTTVVVQKEAPAKVVQKAGVAVEKKIVQPAEEAAILKAMDGEADPNVEPQVRQFMQPSSAPRCGRNTTSSGPSPRRPPSSAS